MTQPSDCQPQRRRAQPDLRGMIAAALLCAALPTTAHAHLVSTRFGELYSGMLHPLTTLTHLVPWLALGLLCGMQPRPLGRWGLLAFPVAVLFGVSFSHWLPTSEAVTSLNYLSFVVLGGLVALATRLTPLTFISLTVIVGASHGFANGNSELDGGAWLLYGIGVTLSAYLLITLVAGGATTLASASQGGRIAVRAAGSWVAAIGLVYLGFVWLAVPTP